LVAIKYFGEYKAEDEVSNSCNTPSQTISFRFSLNAFGVGTQVKLPEGFSNLSNVSKTDGQRIFDSIYKLSIFFNTYAID